MYQNAADHSLLLLVGTPTTASTGLLGIIYSCYYSPISQDGILASIETRLWPHGEIDSLVLEACPSYAHRGQNPLPDNVIGR